MLLYVYLMGNVQQSQKNQKKYIQITTVRCLLVVHIALSLDSTVLSALGAGGVEL